MSRPDRTDEQADDVHTGPSATYMRSRIQYLTTTFIRQFSDILDVTHALDDKPQSTAEIANRQLTVTSATEAMIRAAEEFMMLTRTMKELWLFGELDTVEQEEDIEKKRNLAEDESVVIKGMQEWLDVNTHRLTTRAVEADIDKS